MHPDLMSGLITDYKLLLIFLAQQLYLLTVTSPDGCSGVSLFLLVFIFVADIMRASLARSSRSALVELISLAIPLLVVINLPGGAESRARLLTHINRWHKVACIPENLKVRNLK